MDPMNRARLISLAVLIVLPIVAAASQLLVLEGEVLIQHDGPRAIQAFIQPDSTGITHVLRLSAEEGFVQNPLSFHLVHGKAIVREDRVTILDENGKLAVVFALFEAPDVHVDIDEPRLGRARLASGPDRAILRDAIVLRGYGLSIQKITPGQYIATVKRSREVAASNCLGCVENPDPGGGGLGGSGCDSGGTGSTSCSCSGGVGSCSTTCSAGYYACCKGCTNNNPSCTCVQIR